MRTILHPSAATAILLMMMWPHPSFSQGRTPRDPPGLEQLRRESAGTARTSLHRGTGRVRFVRVEPGRLALAGPDPDERGQAQDGCCLPLL